MRKKRNRIKLNAYTIKFLSDLIEMYEGWGYELDYTRPAKWWEVGDIIAYMIYPNEEE